MGMFSASWACVTVAVSVIISCVIDSLGNFQFLWAETQFLIADMSLSTGDMQVFAFKSTTKKLLIHLEKCKSTIYCTITFSETRTPCVEHLAYLYQIPLE